MTPHKNLSETVYRLIGDWHHEILPGSVPQWEESILLRDGFLWGRKFRAGVLEVVWDFSGNRLVFTGLDGQGWSTRLTDVNGVGDVPVYRAA